MMAEIMPIPFIARNYWGENNRDQMMGLFEQDKEPGEIVMFYQSIIFTELNFKTLHVNINKPDPSGKDNLVGKSKELYNKLFGTSYNQFETKDLDEGTVMLQLDYNRPEKKFEGFFMADGEVSPVILQKLASVCNLVIVHC